MRGRPAGDRGVRGAPRRDAGRAAITYIYPTLNPETRTARVRVELPNPGLRLKPGMYATLRIAAPRPTRRSPCRAPPCSSTGERSLVFVQAAGRRARAARRWRSARRSDDRIEILRGLAAGRHGRRLGHVPRRRRVEPRHRARRHGRHARHGHLAADRATPPPGRPPAHQPAQSTEAEPCCKRIIDWSVRNRLLVVLLHRGGDRSAASGRSAGTPLEALPDLSDVQVIVQADYNEQAPRIVEDQVTYPIAAEMLKVPGARTVRGYSFFGVSFVYVIFEDGTDLYWARSRACSST